VSATFDQPRPRASDGRAPDPALIVDRTTTVRFLALTTLVLSQTFDLATFQWMVGQHGLDAELNPLVQDLFMSYGMVAMFGAKAALIVLVGALFVATWTRRRGYVRAVAGGLPIALAITAGLIGGITNAATILP
jgi:hypothetical protein